ETARTPPTEVVDAVVAVRRDAQLAKPTEQERGRRVDIDRAEHNMRALDQTVAGILGRTFGGRGSPRRYDRNARHGVTVLLRSRIREVGDLREVVLVGRLLG